MFAIIISEKGGAERREAFDRLEITVGRVQGNDLMLPKGNVSKRHARLVFREGRFVVTDLNSTNGTYVNRRRIAQPTIIREGDRVYIGDFVLRIDGGEAEGGESASSPRSSLDPQPGRESRSGSDPVVLPAVPRPPRLPSPQVSDAISRDVHPSTPGHPRPSVAFGLAPSSPDPLALAHRAALASVIERVKRGLEAGALERTTPELRARVSPLIGETIAALRSEGVISANADVQRLLLDAQSELLEAGALEVALRDDRVVQVVVTRHDVITALRADGESLVEPPFTSATALTRALQRLCERAGEPLLPHETVVERMLPGGLAMSAVLPPAITPGPVAMLRRSPVSRTMLDDLVRIGAASVAVSTFLEQCAASAVNVLVVGPRDLGTTEVVAAIAAASGGRHVLAQRSGGLALASDTLHVHGAHDIAERVLEVIGRVPAARLVIELGSPGLLAGLASAVAAGAEGIIAVAYASGLRRGLGRLAADLAAARSGTSADLSREWLAGAFDVVVEVARLRDGRYRVSRVCEVGETASELQDVFTFVADRTAGGSVTSGTFVASGAVPRVIADLVARGHALDTSIFLRR